jgi:hypothetical protein
MVQDVNPRLYQDLNTLKSLGSALPNNPLLGVSRDFSKTKGTQTLATPAQDAGLAVIQDGAITTKSGVGNRFSYSLDDDTYFYASFPTVTGVRNTTTGWQEIGKILVPGDSLSLAPNAVASFSVTSGANLTSCQLAVLISPRNNSVRSQTKYYVVKDLGSGFASTTAQIKVLMNAIHPGMLQLGQVDAGTAPTSYPDSSYNKVFETVSEQEAVEEERRLIASFPPLTLMNVQAGEVIINDAKRKSRDEEAAALLIVMKDELGSWGAVGERLGINKGLPYSVVTGRIKRSSPVRRALGLTLD